MIVYIDSKFKCHAQNDGTMQEVESDFFNGKCQEFIEGYRFVPDGAVWVREDGVEFNGMMITPWKPWPELDKAQVAWEHEQLAIVTADRDALLEDMAELIEEIYQEDLEVIG